MKTAFQVWRVVTAMSLVGAVALGAPIPGLFNTGVDADGALLGAGEADPHYTLIESADPAYPGPDALVVTESWPVAPAGPWIANGPNSKWIAPRADQGVGNEVGNYTFRTTFNLAGYDPSKARITVMWTSDNAGLDIVLNDVSLGLSQPGNFLALAESVIDYGFVDGVNTLAFIVNNAGDAVNPAGLRVEMIGTVEVAGEPPRIIAQPNGRTVLVGADVVLNVVADGTPPLEYQWYKDDQPLSGATDPTLTLAGIATAEEGAYHVVVRNGVSEKPSDKAQVNVLERFAGLYSTGVGDDAFALEDAAVDPHYKLVVNPDGESQDALVQDSTLFPIVEGPWLANSDTSKWIGPRVETVAAAGGDYTYRLTIDMTGFDPTTAIIWGQWSSDNAGVGVLLNGAPTGVTYDGNFGAMSPTFAISSGFLAGVNTLDFVVNNAAAGYTGLRVDNLRGGAKKGSPGDKPRVVAQPQDVLAFTGDKVKFSVVADGKKPLTYEWRFGATVIPNSDSSDLVLENVTPGNAGEYSVVISNSAGSIPSDPATLAVYDPVPGVFGTGVGSDGKALADGEIDPHYEITVNPDGLGDDAIVQDSTVFPIVTGPWLPNTEVCKWIGPRFETSAAAAGDYVYTTTLDLTGFDPATVVLAGQWSSDNVGLDMNLNGASLGIGNGAQFGGYTSFKITSGFKEGLNTLDFILNNASAGYTGLRVNSLRAGGVRSGPRPRPSLEIAKTGSQIRLSWPATATGFSLIGADTLTSPTWTPVNEPVVQEGGLNKVTVSTAGTARFFMLME